VLGQRAEGERGVLAVREVLDELETAIRFEGDGPLARSVSLGESLLVAFVAVLGRDAWDVAGVCVPELNESANVERSFWRLLDRLQSFRPEHVVATERGHLLGKRAA